MSDDVMGGIYVMRVPISLPCDARVRPGTPDTSGPIEDRPEFCAVDAFWMVGKAMICTHHLRELWPDLLADMEHDPEFNGYAAVECLPWEQMHRYAQPAHSPSNARDAQ